MFWVPGLAEFKYLGKTYNLTGEVKPVEITITGGLKANRVRRGYTLPKRELVFNLLKIYQQGRLKVARALPLAPVLTEELTNFKMKVSAAGNDQYEAWREGIHDDLILSIAIAIWLAEYKARHLRG
jgi:hypothetical protein